MRIVSWNVENLAPWLDGNAADLPAMHERLGSPDVLCLQEVRIRPHDEPRVARMQSALPGFTCHASLNHDPHNGAFRGGRAYGVATWLRAGLDAVPLRFPWDTEGRVIVCGLPSAGLAIVNAYAVNGTGRPHWDAGRDGPHGDRHQFKQRFIERLGEELQALRIHGLARVLIGDWNVSRTAAPAHGRTARNRATPLQRGVRRRPRPGRRLPPPAPGRTRLHLVQSAQPPPAGCGTRRFRPARP